MWRRFEELHSFIFDFREVALDVVDMWWLMDRWRGAKGEPVPLPLLSLACDIVCQETRDSHRPPSPCGSRDAASQSVYYIRPGTRTWTINLWIESRGRVLEGNRNPGP